MYLSVETAVYFVIKECKKEQYVKPSSNTITGDH